jgi:hypothetical protein
VTALSVPSVAFTNAIRLWGVVMSVFYIGNDSEIDAERCWFSLGKKEPITIFGLSLEGRAACFTGVVQSIQFDPKRERGSRWRVVMGEPALHRADDTSETGTSST